MIKFLWVGVDEVRGVQLWANFLQSSRGPGPGTGVGPRQASESRSAGLLSVCVTGRESRDCSQLVKTKYNFISIAEQPRARYKPISTGKEFIILSLKINKLSLKKWFYKLQPVLVPGDCCYLLFEGKEKCVNGLSVIAASF